MRKIKKGATLLEVVIGLAIIAIMIMPLMNSLLTSVRANKKGEEVQDAKLLGQQIIEKLRLQDEIKKKQKIEIGEEKYITLGDIKPREAYDKDGTAWQEYYEIPKTNIDSFEVEGKIWRNNIKDITTKNNNLEKKLGAFIELSKNGVRYYEINSENEGLSILDIYKNNDKFKEIDEKSINVVFNKMSQDGTKNIYEIKTEKPQKNLGYSTIDYSENKRNSIGIGVYIKDSFEEEGKEFNINFKNSSDKLQDITFFRSSDVLRENGRIGISKEEEKNFNIYENIIFDLRKENGEYKFREEIGLYTAELEIKKDGKEIEKIESQFYIGE